MPAPAAPPVPPPAAPPVPSTVSLDKTDGLAMTALYRAAIGPVHTDYYQSVFDRFETMQRASWSWNWAAAVCTLNWLVFRNLWGPALIYTAILMVIPMLLGLGRLVFRWPGAVENGLLLSFLILCMVIPGGVANAVLYAKCRHQMAVALAETTTLADACAVLAHQASSRRRWISLALINAFAGSIVALMYWWAPLDTSTKTHVLPGLMPPHALPEPSSHAPASAASLPVRPPEPVRASAPVPAPVPAFVPASIPVSAMTPVPTPASAPVSTASPPVILPQPSARTAAHPDADTSRPQSSSKAQKTKAPHQARASIHVDVGRFADAGNAHKVHARLVAADIPAFIKEVQTRKGILIKVGAGPFETRSQARAAIAKIHALGLDAVLAKP